MGIKKTFVGVLFATLLMSLAGCERDDRHSGSAGKLNLRIVTSGAVTDVTTRSAEEDVPDINNFSMAMLQGSNVQASWDKISDYDDDTTFPVGTYTLRAFYGDMQTEGFASPYYEGSTDVEIKGGLTTEVETTCKLANTKLTIGYTDDFKSYFKTYSTVVKSEQGGEAIFKSAETRAAYVKPGRVSVKVIFTKAEGTMKLDTVEVATIEEALPQHHYHLSMDVDAGKAMLSVIFDRVTEEKPITLDISDKALNIKAPYFTLTGFEKTSDDKNQWDGNLTEANKLSALLTSLGGFKKCILKTTSPNLEDWPAGGIDLANLTDETLNTLTHFGFKLTGFGTNKDQMAIIDLTGVVPHLNISDANSEHLFYLQATSAYGKQSEEYVLNITTPKNFMLLPADPVKMKSTEVTIPVKLKIGNSQNIKLYYKYYGMMTLINTTTIAPADKEGYYNIKATNIDMGFAAKDFQAEYMGVKSAIVTVGVIIPKYTFSLNSENIWSYSANMTIVPENAGDLLNLMSAIEPYISLDGTTWKKWENISLDVNTGKVVLKGLTAGAKYYFRTTCDDGETFTNSVMYTMEATTQLSDFTQGWTSFFSGTINKGGGYGWDASWGSDKKQEKEPLVATDLSVGWSTVNRKTVPTNPTNQNTWYMVPSALENNEGILLRNVAWSDGLGAPPSKYGATKWTATSLTDLAAPSHEHRSAGKLFLGSYSYNHSNDVEEYTEGIGFASRPIKLKGTYTYEAYSDEGGKVIVAVENREGGQVLPLASGECLLTPTSVEASFEVTLNYTVTNKKATHLRVMFASSSNASNSQSVEDGKIKTSDDKANAVSIGSKLYLNKNITLEYK